MNLTRLQLRSSKDLKDTLLHEMIHAHMMLNGAGALRSCEYSSIVQPSPPTPSVIALHQLPCALRPPPRPAADIRDDDKGGHGTVFKSHLRRINSSSVPDTMRPPGGCARPPAGRPPRTGNPSCGPAAAAAPVLCGNSSLLLLLLLWWLPLCCRYNIATHHDWSAEVDHYRTHHWRCQKCALLVKRATNRPPQPADCR